MTQNDYGVGLYNGDIGIAMSDPVDQRLRVYFDMPDGSIRGVMIKTQRNSGLRELLQ